jgi:hypothetical protein
MTTPAKLPSPQSHHVPCSIQLSTCPPQARLLFEDLSDEQEQVSSDEEMDELQNKHIGRSLKDAAVKIKSTFPDADDDQQPSIGSRFACREHTAFHSACGK